MMQPVSWRRAPLIWSRARWPQFVGWAPHGPMHPACDPRNDPPPEGWHWAFAMQAQQEGKEQC